MNKEEYEKSYWRYYLLLEQEFIETLDYVELTPENYSTISIKYVKLLLDIGSEVDNMFKVCSGLTGRVTINNYIAPILEKYPNIMEQGVKALSYNVLLKPFDGWNTREPSQSLTFWESYNSVKHDRILNFTKASLESVANALAALFTLEMYFILDIYNMNVNEFVSVPTKESRLFVLDNWKVHMRSSKVKDNYEYYNDDNGERII